MKKCLNCSIIIKNKPISQSYCNQQCDVDHKKKQRKEIIQSDQPYYWRSIRNYLIETVGRCQNCGIHEWLSKPISLDCDHIDGDITNNRLSNARLLCPNCHSQTHTYKAKNINNPHGKAARRARYLKTVEAPEGFEPPFATPLQITA
jgi:5-methylcytosine-specific restriction endonuclease McrA